MRLFRCCLIGILLGLGACCLTGCLSDDPEEGDLPWSDPAGWENGGFAIPM